MNRRELLNEVVTLAIGAAVGVVVEHVLFDVYADRRFALYNILRGLKAGMSRQEVEAVIQRHDAPFITTRNSEDGIELLVHLGAVNALYLSITLSNNTLASAKIVGEDGPHDVPADAPLSI